MKFLQIISIFCIIIKIYFIEAYPQRITINKTTIEKLNSEATEIAKEHKNENTEENRCFHPVEVQKPRVIDHYDHRQIDGQYEIRYVLNNGEARYERAYWTPFGETKILARMGYFSYPTTNQRFLTVHYRADQNGYHEMSSTLTLNAPVLPRHIDVPAYETSAIHTKT